MSAAPSILLIGAGELGTSVLEALAAHPKRNGGSIAILLRQSSISSPDARKRAQLDHFKSLGASLVAGDLAHDSEDKLAEILARFHTVIACSGFGLPAGTQAKLTRAVLGAGVGRYVPWQWGVDYDAVGAGSAQDLFDEQLEVRALLRSQSRQGTSTSTGTDWAIVSTGLFMSFLFQRAFGVVDLRGRKVRALGSWDARLTLTTARDVGRMAAEVVYDAGIKGEEAETRGVVYVAGDTVTYARVAELVEKRFGGEWTRELWDEEFLRGKLRERPEDGMLKYTNVWAKGRGVAWDMQRTVNARRGVELQSLESYLREMPDL
ncbi:isoflavone reductase family protein [Daldinia bambusicola]|nr:isoflavone reductase family protein [Daldinia bambusicola]